MGAAPISSANFKFRGRLTAGLLKRKSDMRCNSLSRSQFTKMNQPIFVITRSNFERAFDGVLRERQRLPRFDNSYLQWGKGNIDTVAAKLREIKFDHNDEVLVSTVMEVLNSLFTAKMVRGANDCLKFYKKQVKYKRSIKNDSR